MRGSMQNNEKDMLETDLDRVENFKNYLKKIRINILVFHVQQNV